MDKLLAPGSVLQDRYRIVQFVGEGATGAVYIAEDSRHPGARWAVKEMTESIHDEREKQEALSMFVRECEILKKLNHSGLPKVIDSFTTDRGHYLVMEYIEGESLLAKFKAKDGSFTPQEIMPWVSQILDILEYLHSQSPPVVFRDLKPSNIMITAGGRAKLIDFGIARHFTPGKVKDTYIMGTPGFSAPEQYGGRQTDPRSDVYALAATMYFLISGEDPEQFSFKFPPLSQFNRSVDPWLSRVIAKALEVDPENRIQSAAAMKAQLKMRGDSPGVTQAPAPLVGAVAGSWYHSVMFFNSPWKTFGICMLLVAGSCIPFLGGMSGCLGFVGIILLSLVSLVAAIYHLITKDFRTASTAFWVMCASGAIMVLPLAVFLPGFLGASDSGNVTACKSNLKNIGTALEMYSTDYAGRYPTALSALTPMYLKTIPTCPGARSDTYSQSFRSSENPDAYTVFCQGLNHKKNIKSPDFPKYDSFSGLIEAPLENQ